MGTGELVRDFHKDDRELRYKNSGSIRFTEKEHNAYRLSLTLEVTHIDAPRYGNKKTLPDNTHYGYCTLFKGSTVTDTIAIKYPKFRVFDILNQGIWNYHQGTEDIQIDAGVAEISANTSSNGILGKLGDWLGGAVCFWIKIDYSLGGGGPTSDFLLSALNCDSGEDESESLAKKYRGFPIGSPFPDVVKFKSDIPCSFLWRLESWYLVEPSIYAEDSPTDTGDQTGGEDEYPEPDGGDGDGDGDEFPDSDAPDPDSDPRDTDGGSDGSDFPGVTNIRYLVDVFTNPGLNTATVRLTKNIGQFQGKVGYAQVGWTCLRTYPSGFPTAGKCTEVAVSVRGTVVFSQETSWENPDLQVDYFPNGV